jgi:L-seryl-tRNA(Ser) seleniumtransferase
VPGNSVIGGGATPEQTIPTWLIAVEYADVVQAERRLREGDPPIVARIEDGRLALDLRTVLPGEEGFVERALTGTLIARSSDA